MIVYWPGATFENLKRPSLPRRAELLPIPGTSTLPPISDSCTALDEMPDGSATVPSTAATGTCCSWKSTPLRSSLTPTETTPAFEADVVPG
jgi:hypothetical protein